MVRSLRRRLCWSRLGIDELTFTDDGGTANPRFAGLLGGGEIGYNYQAGKWVFGIEGDAGGTNTRGARPCPTGFFYNCEINTNWLSTVTARIGYAHWDRLLVYTKGGAAIAQDRAESRCNTGSQPADSCSGFDWMPLPKRFQNQGGMDGRLGFRIWADAKCISEGRISYFDLGSDRYNIAGIPTDIQRSGFISTSDFASVSVDSQR